MPETKKPSLSVSKFIFCAANDEDFRKKYLADPGKLNEEYAMTASDTEDIMALDLVKVDNQIKSFAKLDLIRGNVNLAASHTKNSHTSHSKDAHSNSSHSNGADRLSSLRMDELVNTLRTIATREEIR